MVDRTQTCVSALLGRISSEGLPAVKQLLSIELNYRPADRQLSYRRWTDPPTVLAQHDSRLGALRIIQTERSTDLQGGALPLSVSTDRPVINQL